MTHSDQNPKLPLWLFIVIDLLLIGAAVLINSESKHPLSAEAAGWIAGCVMMGAVAVFVPLIAHYERAKNALLDDRQRALEGLARTVIASAEQISIATSGLNEISELTQKSLRHADHLPQKLHEKVAEFQAQLSNANAEEKEELEKEVAELRAAESERLQSTADKIAKSAAEWAKLEAATQKHLATATDSFAKTQAQTAATLDEKLSAAIAALDAKLAALEAAAARLASLPPPTPAPAAAPAPMPPPAPTEAPVAPVATAAVATESVSSPTESAAKTETPAHPPKKPRKPRRETPVVEEPPAPVAEENPKSETESPKPDEPPPVPAEKIPEVSPIAPHTAEPFTAENAEQNTEAEKPRPESGAATTEPDESKAAPPSVPDSPPAEPKPPRKRAPKKPAPEAHDGEPSLGLDEPPAPPPAVEVTERALSSDGATRLLVTAYIGIGNRLFIRGDGPGLSWEKGVPLQFVSIGKWRWETATATTPVKFKLYKNDEAECTALGAQSLDPGQQQEMTAAF